ncbi:MAG: mechanosensitive ion channel family protein [Thermoanaerobaculia bacterium]
MKLPDLLHGNGPGDLITAASIAAATFLLVWAIRTLARRKLSNAHLTPSEVDDFFRELAQRTRLWLLVFPSIYLGARALALPVTAGDLIRSIAMFTMIIQTTFWATGAVDFWLKRYQRQRLESDPQAVTTLGAFRIAIVAGLWIVATIFAIETLTEFDVTTLVAGLGIGGVAIALATQNILGDLFASLSIVIDKPFAIGDFIIVGESMGTVEHIGLKSTRLRSISGEQLIIGNGDLLKSRIHNQKRMYERRVVFRIGVVYGTPADTLERIPQIIRTAIEKHERTRFDRSHLVSFGESSLEFETVYWVLSSEYIVYADLHQAIGLDLIRTLGAEGIEFAFPTRTLHVKEVRSMK